LGWTAQGVHSKSGSLLERCKHKNPSQEHYGSKKMRNWDYGIRNRDQDSQGVMGEVVFPNTVPPFYRKKHRHRASTETRRPSAMLGRHPCPQSLAEGFLC
jgi:hypothetical protein